MIGRLFAGLRALVSGEELGRDRAEGQTTSMVSLVRWLLSREDLPRDEEISGKRANGFFRELLTWEQLDREQSGPSGAPKATLLGTIFSWERLDGPDEGGPDLQREDGEN